MRCHQLLTNLGPFAPHTADLIAKVVHLCSQHNAPLYDLWSHASDCTFRFLVLLLSVRWTDCCLLFNFNLLETIRFHGVPDAPCPPPSDDAWRKHLIMLRIGDQIFPRSLPICLLLLTGLRLKSVIQLSPNTLVKDLKIFRLPIKSSHI